MASAQKGKGLPTVLAGGGGVIGVNSWVNETHIKSSTHYNRNMGGEKKPRGEAEAVTRGKRALCETKNGTKGTTKTGRKWLGDKTQVGREGSSRDQENNGFPLNMTRQSRRRG